MPRARVRELGLAPGILPTGIHNAITDVPGVLVGHSTIIESDGELEAGQGPVRTGVTAILPNGGEVWEKRVVASGFVLNGAGEVSGLTQLMEWGILETPIILTNTMSVGTCSEAVSAYMVKKHPGIGAEQDVVIPVVGECDDSWLNDIAGHHVQARHVLEALNGARSGPVAEGCVGGGTGMVCCDFKAGIGTASRLIQGDGREYVIGSLVMSNFGFMQDLRFDGLPAGRVLAPEFSHYRKRENNYGSIIVVLATNAPLSSIQIGRLCKRASLAVGRVGSFAAHGSGEIVVGFSTGNIIPRKRRQNIYRMDILLDRALDSLYRAAVECTEEAILNSLCMAETMVGHSGHTAPAIPLDRLREMARIDAFAVRSPLD